MAAEQVAVHWARARAPSRRKWGLILFCYLALAPVLALFAYIRLVPIAWSVILSLYSWDFISLHKPFVGLGNYVRLMADENLLQALKNTTEYSAATVIVSPLVALPLPVRLAAQTRLACLSARTYFLSV